MLGETSLLGRLSVPLLMTTTKELWENALVELELTISKPNFNTWFKDTHIVRVEDGTVALGVPSQFARDWLSTKFHKDIFRRLLITIRTRRA